ncbi:cation:proton antiporter [Streptomyces hawaiiensis]|uniref:cation:proton antiporter n=1 Tax=Streptomyces hawaiiensis TaxID=67305 RepID=UPI00364FD5F2
MRTETAAAVAPVAPLGHTALLVLLVQLGVLLALALLLGRLAARLGWPAVVGELCAGVLLGPSVLAPLAPSLSGWLFPQQAEQVHLLDAVGQFGVLLLVGISGLHLDLGMIRRQGATAARISLFGLVVPLGLGLALGLVLPGSLLAESGDRTVFALFLGVAMCVSAIPVIAKTLMDMHLLHRNIGQLTLAAGMIDDAVGWLLVSVVTAMATTGVTAGTVLSSVAALLAVVLLAALFARWPVPALYRRAGRADGAGPAITLTAVLVLLSAAGTHALGLEPLFGAFLCGVAISAAGGGGVVLLAPLRAVVLGVLAPIFLASAGLRMDLTTLVRPEVAALGVSALAVAILGKFAGAYLGARTSRLSGWEALALGAGMNARGVVEVVLAMVGLRLGVLTTATYTVVVLVAVVTSVMAPPVIKFAMARIEPTPEEERRRRLHLGDSPRRDTADLTSEGRTQ